MDPVAEKIRISEYRINNGQALWTLPLAASPVFILAIGFMCGIIIQTYFDLPKSVLFILSVSLTAFLTVVSFRGVKLHNAALAGMTAFMVGGMCREYFADHHQADHINSIVADAPISAEIYGTVISEPVFKPAAVQKQYKADSAAAAYQSGGAVSFYLRLAKVKSTKGIVPVEGTVYARISGIPPDADTGKVVGAGKSIRLYCILSRPGPADEKWQFDFKKYLNGKMVEVTASAKYPAILQSQPLHNSLAMRVFYGFQKHALSAKISSLLAPRQDDDQADGLLAALVLGRRTNLTPQVRQAFTTTGLMHVLSLSGMHVGILCGGIWTFLRFLGVRQRLAAGIVLPGIIFFLYIIPMQAPALRACIIAVTFACATIFSRKPSAINTLSIAAIITLLINPRDLFSAGWQLSFGCVLSMILLTAPILGFLHDLTNHRFSSRFTDKIIDHRNMALSFLVAVSVSVAAWIGSFGILLYHFGAVYPYSCLCTVLLAIPIIVVINFSMLTIVVVAIIPASEGFMTAISHYLASSLIEAVELLAKIPHSEMLTGYPPLYIIVLLYAAMITFGLAVFILNRPLRVFSYLILLVFAMCAAGWTYSEFDKDSLRITFLPVGHGQCVVAEFGGENIMIDCGSSTFDDCGQRIVSPFLRSRKIAKIDKLIITHPHLDHINGLDYIIDRYSPETIYTNSDCEGFGDAARVIAEKTVISGHEGLEIEILPPLSRFESLNDKSLVTLITFGGQKILIPADVEKDRQRELLDMGIKADVLVMPHHGSTVTTLEDFAEKINPTKIIPATIETSTKPRTLIIPKANRPD